MSSYITGSTYNASSGFFEITTTNVDGTTSTQSVNFSTLCMIYSLSALGSQDEVFAAQFAESQAQVSNLSMVNDCIQMFSDYTYDLEDGSTTFTLTGVVDEATYKQSPYTDADGVVHTYESHTFSNGDVMYYETGTDAEAWATVYYPGLVESGIVTDGDGGCSGVGTDGCYTSTEIDSFISNLQTAQTTLSSQNEQQMLITNDAASKRSTILQLAQTLLKEASDARSTAAQT